MIYRIAILTIKNDFIQDYDFQEDPRFEIYDLQQWFKQRQVWGSEWFLTIVWLLNKIPDFKSMIAILQVSLFEITSYFELDYD